MQDCLLARLACKHLQDWLDKKALEYLNDFLFVIKGLLSSCNNYKIEVVKMGSGLLYRPRIVESETKQIRGDVSLCLPPLESQCWAVARAEGKVTLALVSAPSCRKVPSPRWVSTCRSVRFQITCIWHDKLNALNSSLIIFYFAGAVFSLDNYPSLKW